MPTNRMTNFNQLPAFSNPPVVTSFGSRNDANEPGESWGSLSMMALSTSDLKPSPRLRPNEKQHLRGQCIIPLGRTGASTTVLAAARRMTTSTIVEQLGVAREQALLGEYSAALVYYDGVVAQLNRPVQLGFTSTPPHPIQLVEFLLMPGGGGIPGA